MFQSSPDPKAGRSLTHRRLAQAHRGVSILARPEGRAQHLLQLHQRAGHRPVSILARPEGRAQPPRAACGSGPGHSFNPRPTRRPGAAAAAATVVMALPMFQSSPDPKAGRSLRIGAGVAAGVRVSILARPEGRAQPGARRRDGRDVSGFNPRPTRRPGAASRRIDAPLTGRGVSILARPEGRAQRPAPACAPTRPCSFNPRPTRRPGAAREPPHPARPPPRVSILARPEGRAQRRGRS